MIAMEAASSMGCNAWNHPADCRCGWGGDTGGGHGGSAVRHVQLASGRDWRADKPQTIDSFVNPNARCPVCQTPVFYYQSPFGGRVFFDALGIPWPKHPCTDQYWQRERRNPAPLIHRYIGSPLPPTPPAGAFGWKPLPVARVSYNGAYDLIFPASTVAIAGAFLPTAAGRFEGRPIYWRHHCDAPEMVELTSIDVDGGGRLSFLNETVPGWIRSEEELATWLAEGEISPSAWYQMGWMLSFHWKVSAPLADRATWRAHPSIHWGLAQRFFEQASIGGERLADNALGVMYREGYGILADPEQAFRLFLTGSESLHPKALINLAGCYFVGSGVEKDRTAAAAMFDLALLSAEEQGFAETTIKLWLSMYKLAGVTGTWPEIFR